MLRFQSLPIHHPPEPVKCIALHKSLAKIAVARANCIVEIWDRAPDACGKAKDSSRDNRTPFHLSRLHAGIRGVTIRDLFWDEDDIRQGDIVVAATLSGQFILYSSYDLNIVGVVNGASEGFFAVSLLHMDVKQTLPNGTEFHSIFAAATGNGFIKLFTTCPNIEYIATGSKNSGATVGLSVCFSKNGNFVFIGDDTGSVQKFIVRRLLEAVNGSQTNAECVYNLSIDGKKAGLRPAPLSMCCSSNLFIGTHTGDIFVVCLKSDTILTSFRGSKASILTTCFITEETILVGSITRDLVTLQLHGSKWLIGSTTRRVHCNDITCVVSSHSIRRSTQTTSSETMGGSQFLCITGGADGELFCSTSIEAFRRMFSKSILQMKQNVLKYTPFRFRSDAYSISSLDESQILLSALSKNAICLFKLSSSGTRAQSFMRLGLPKRGNNIRFLATTQDSSFLMHANYTHLEILKLTWKDACPNAVERSTIDASAIEKLKGIQGIAFGWGSDREWFPFVAVKNEIIVISMATGSFTSRFEVSCQIVKIAAHQSILLVLCSNDEYIIWDDEKGIVLLSTVSMVQKSGESASSGPVEHLLLRNEHFFKKTSSDSIVDVCFMHKDSFHDFRSPPSAFVLLNNRGQFKVISIEDDTLGLLLYASETVCPSVYPLPGFTGHGSYSVACIRRGNRKGSLLEDNCVCVYSASNVAVFDLTAEYTEGAKLSSRNSFVKSCSSVISRKECTPETLFVFPAQRALLVTSFPHGDNRKHLQDEKGESLTKAHEMCVLAQSSKEFLANMRVYDAKRYAT